MFRYLSKKNKPKIKINLKRSYVTQKKKNVLILGWFGAKDKQLKKFSDFYQDLNCNTVISKTDIFKSMNYNQWKKWQQQGPFTEIDRQKFDIVHLFSGSVFRYYNWMLHNQNAFDHSKIIFDSGPYYPEPQQINGYTKSLTPVLNKIPYYDNILNNSINTYWKNQGFDYIKGSSDYIEHMNCGRDKMIIYGGKDNMLDFDKINLFYQNCIKKNSNTKKIVFPNAGHLQNYKLNPKEYTEEIKMFIES